MKKSCVLGILALATVAAAGQPQSLQGAKVTRLQGQVQVKESSVWRLLKEGEQLAESTLVKLAQGSHLSLRYRADGHREEAQGPGELRVGKGDLNGAGKLERFGFKNRTLQIPRSGGLDAVGGSVANAAKTYPRPSAQITQSPVPSAVLPVKPVSDGSRDPDLRLRSDLAEPEPIPLELAWDSSIPSLVDPNSFGVVVGGGQRQAVLFQGDAELARLPVPRDRPLDLAAFASQPDSLYRIELNDGGFHQGSLTFRVLEQDEAKQLSELKLAVNVSLDQRLERMDRFSELGQYHLVAEEGGRWLRDSDPLKDPQKTAAVLQLVYDVNRDILRDSRQTKYWIDWADVKKVPLIQ